MFKSEKLNQLLAAVTPEQKYKSFAVDMFLEDFNLSTYDGTFDYTKFSERVSQADLVTWICTDTGVGIYAYYFDDKLVAVSFQPARKSYISLEWVSRELRVKMREFMLSLYTIDHVLEEFYLIDNDVTDEVIQSYEDSQYETEIWNKTNRH